MSFHWMHQSGSIVIKMVSEITRMLFLMMQPKLWILTMMVSEIIQISSLLTTLRALTLMMMVLGIIRILMTIMIM